ncbi:MAG: hypothetical protein EXX96DRAFT_577830 [Benjaminiella poitrasii]|nr:MAG: hypothetical protein EXX96DRAFT_577830 [Benjaminiella poitrasii]
MPNENEPLLSKRQAYLSCSETIIGQNKPSSDSANPKIITSGLARRRLSNGSHSSCEALSLVSGGLKRRNMSYKQRVKDYLKQFSTSTYLENTAAVARDHLANERTYLAWVRTSLSMISVGIAITQLFRLDSTIHPHSTPTSQYSRFYQGKLIGIVFIIMALFYILFAFIRYFHSQAALTKGYFPASRGIILLTSISLLATFFILLVILLRQ